MPMLTMLRIGLPVWPFHSPLRTRLAESRHFVEHRMDFRHDIPAVHEDGGIAAARAEPRAARRGFR